MKQMVMFEPHDLALLHRGESLTLRVGDQEVTIGYAGPRLPRNGGRPATAPTSAPVAAATPTTCPVCAKTYTTRSIMGQHLRKAHGQSLRPSRPGQNPATVERTCPTCHGLYKNRASMAEHHRRKHGPLPAAAKHSGVRGPAGRSYRHEVQPSKYRTLLCTVSTCPRSRPQYGFTRAEGLANHMKYWHHQQKEA